MINIGVIGYGVRVDMLMDALFFKERGVRIAAIADPDKARVQALICHNVCADEMHRFELDKIDATLRTCSLDFNAIHFYNDAEAMLENEALDGVILGARCDMHAVLAQKVLARGIPLFLEKPVGITAQDIALLAALEKQNAAPVVVSFPLRVTSLVREAKKMIDAGAIGKVEHVQAFNDVPYGFVYFHDWYRDESIAHGLFLQKATHDIDVIRYLTGATPVKVCAMKSKQIYKGDMPAGLRCSACDRQETCMDSTYNITYTRGDTPRSDWCGFAKDTGNEDSGSMLVRCASGMHVMYSQNFFARKGAARRGARLYGYEGTLEFNFATNKITVYDHMSDKVTLVEMPAPQGMHGGGDLVLMQNFLDLIEGKTQTSVAPLSAGIVSAATCLAAKTSSETDEFVEVKSGCVD